MREIKKVKYLMKRQVNYLSGTMSPARQDDELESISWVVNYYKENEVNELVVQPKFMGSRVQVYLTDDPFVVTRKGSVKKLDYDYNPIRNKLESYFGPLEFAILDAELLPWSYLAKGLIEREFLGISEMMRRELYILEKNGLMGQIQGLAAKFDNLGEVDKTQFIEEHGHHTWRAYLAYKRLQNEFIPLDVQLDNLDKYEAQVKYYQDGPLEIKPFNILKIKQGAETVFPLNNFMAYNLLNDIPCVVTNHTQAVEEYYDVMVKTGYEGIVIKPLQITYDQIPYFKVRNPEYLRIIYGPNYLEPNYYNKLKKRKRIGWKMRNSVKDWQRGWDMLQIPNDEVPKSEKMFNLMLSHLTSEQKAKGVDPRL